MNSVLAMDQSEKVGLGAAVGGHALLLALLVFGLFQAARPAGSDGGGSGDGIAVEIVSEGSAAAPAVAAPVDVVEESFEQPADVAPEATVEPEPVRAPVPVPVPKPQPKAVSVAKPAAKPATKPVPKPVKPGTGRGSGGSGDFEKQMEKRLGGLGGGGSGVVKTKGPGEGDGKGASLKTAGQIRNEVNAILGPKILRFIRQCAPSGVDVNKIVTTVTLNLAPNGAVTSLTGVSQRGITENNKPQAEPMQRCVTGAIRKAAPFAELNSKDYEGWKTHRMAFQPN